MNSQNLNTGRVLLTVPARHGLQRHANNVCTHERRGAQRLLEEVGGARDNPRRQRLRPNRSPLEGVQIQPPDALHLAPATALQSHGRHGCAPTPKHKQEGGGQPSANRQGILSTLECKDRLHKPLTSAAQQDTCGNTRPNLGKNDKKAETLGCKSGKRAIYIVRCTTGRL